MMSAGDKVDVSNLASDIAANVAKLQEKYPNYTSSVNVTAAEQQALAFIEPLTATRYLFAYHFFGLLWTAQVIQGIGMVTIAGVIAKCVSAHAAAPVGRSREVSLHASAHTNHRARPLRVLVQLLLQQGHHAADCRRRR